MEVDPKTGLPKSISGPPGTVEFLEHKDTTITFLPKAVTLGTRGRYDFNLIDSGFAFNPEVFQDPEEWRKKQKKKQQSVTPVNEPRTPAVKPVDGRLQLLLEDPGNWKERIDLANEQATVLEEQGQTSGLPIYFKRDGKRFMTLPFEPDPAKGSPKFERRKDQIVERLPGKKALIVFPPRGPEEQAIAFGRTMLEAVLTKQGLEAIGPLRVIPYAHPVDGVPGPEKLANLKVQLQLPVRKK